MGQYYNDLIAAASGSGYGCYCPGKEMEGGDGGLLGGGLDAGLLAAGAAATFALYQVIVMLMMRRKKRSASIWKEGTDSMNLNLEWRLTEIVI